MADRLMAASEFSLLGLFTFSQDSTPQNKQGQLFMPLSTGFGNPGWIRQLPAFTGFMLKRKTDRLPVGSLGQHGKMADRLRSKGVASPS